MPNVLTSTIDDWIDWAQVGAACVVALGLLWTYRAFIPAVYRFCARFPGLAIVVAVLYLMIYGLLGAGFGIDYLFWHEDFPIRACSSAGATLLLAVIGVIAYYLDPHPWATAARTGRFLQPDEEIKRRFGHWYARRLPGRRKRPAEDDPGPVVVGWADYWRFVLNVLIDPVAMTPLQTWLDLGPGNTRRLQRFLRTARGPFLLLLLAPAVLPAVFPAVPHVAPTGMLGWFNDRGYQPRNLDVSRDIAGYWIGLAAWLLGIVAGVLLIKVCLSLAALMHRVQVAERLIRAWARLFALFRPIGAAVRAAYERLGVIQGVRRVEARLHARVETADPAGDQPSAGARELAGSAHDSCTLAGLGQCPDSGCPREVPATRPLHPAGCQARDEVRAAALVFAGLFLTLFVYLGLARWIRELNPDLNTNWGYLLPIVPPSFAICLILAVLAMSYAGIVSLGRYWQVAVIAGLVVWFGMANNAPFKNRFEKLSYEEKDIVPLRDRVIDSYDTAPDRRDEVKTPSAGSTPLVADLDALEKWKQFSLVDPDRRDVDSSGRPKLVLVAASGGAARSAYWTAVVLDRLEQELGSSFGHRVRVVCGASGGMLGAACYVDYRRAVAEKKEKGGCDPARPEEPAIWTEERGGAAAPKEGREPYTLLPAWITVGLPKSSLERLSRGIALAEIWKSAWPVTVHKDRGVVLEQDWGRLRYPLRCLAPLEAEGKVPSLIFSPMIVEDGRRLLISNLELGRDTSGRGWANSPIIEAAGRPINLDEFGPDVRNDGTEHRRFSLSSLEYFRLFPTPAHRDLMVSTAVRMSASFPFVSPAVNLPTDPPRRVVDAGYYDNYGVQVATSWIRRNQGWLVKNTSGVLLVQIRDSSSIASRLGVDAARPGWLNAFARGFQFLASPIDAVAKAREATAMFRNDADVAALDSSGWDYGGGDRRDVPAHPESFFTTVIFENSAEVTIESGDFWQELADLRDGQPIRRKFREVAMSWYITRAEMDATVAAIPRHPAETARPATAISGPKGRDWSRPGERRAMMDWLNGRANARDQPSPARPGGPAAPDPDRVLYRKRMDQLANYDRLINLKKWWAHPTR